MSVTGGVVDIQLMHVARLCLCSHTKLAWVPFGDGSHTLRPAGLYSPSKGKYYAVHAKNYSDFERIFWNSRICSVPMSNVVIFLLKSLTRSVCFSKSGTKERSAYEY